MNLNHTGDTENTLKLFACVIVTILTSAAVSHAI